MTSVKQPLSDKRKKVSTAWPFKETKGVTPKVEKKVQEPVRPVKLPLNTIDFTTRDWE